MLSLESGISTLNKLPNRIMSSGVIQYQSEMFLVFGTDEEIIFTESSAICHYSCQGCTKGLMDSACTSCKDGFVDTGGSCLPECTVANEVYSPAASGCVSTGCAAKEYLLTEKVCSTCSSNCASCSMAGICDACDTGFTLLATGTCASDTAPIPVGQYLILGTPKKSGYCHPLCSECTGPSNN